MDFTFVSLTKFVGNYNGLILCFLFNEYPCVIWIECGHMKNKNVPFSCSIFALNPFDWSIITQKISGRAVSGESGCEHCDTRILYWVEITYETKKYRSNERNNINGILQKYIFRKWTYDLILFQTLLWLVIHRFYTGCFTDDVVVSYA